jgi:hypothetical protein
MKHLALLVDVVFGFKSFSEAPHLAWKSGTRRTDSPVRALYIIASQPNLGCCIPLFGFLAMI